METILLDFNRIKILNENQNEKVFQELLAMRKLWLQRNNWHPKVEIDGPDEEIEKYIQENLMQAKNQKFESSKFTGLENET